MRNTKLFRAINYGLWEMEDDSSEELKRGITIMIDALLWEYATEYNLDLTKYKKTIFKKIKRKKYNTPYFFYGDYKCLEKRLDEAIKELESSGELDGK